VDAFSPDKLLTWVSSMYLCWPILFSLFSLLVCVLYALCLNVVADSHLTYICSIHSGES
jgi:hypothetical protein